TFDNLRYTSNAVLPFVNTVNKKFAFDRVPLLAWRTDTNMIDPSSTIGGWKWSSESSKLRLALKESSQSLAVSAQSYEGERRSIENNRGYAQKLLSTIRDERVKEERFNQSAAKFKGRVSAATKLTKGGYEPHKKSAIYLEAVKGIQRALDQGKAFNRAALSPEGIRDVLQVAWEGTEYANAKKAEPSPATAPVGQIDARKNSNVFGSQLDQAFTSIG